MLPVYCLVVLSNESPSNVRKQTGDKDITEFLKPAIDDEIDWCVLFTEQKGRNSGQFDAQLF